MQWNYFLFMKIFIIQFFNSGALQTYNFQININIFQTVGFKSIRQSFVLYTYTYIYIYIYSAVQYIYICSSLTITLEQYLSMSIFDITRVLNIIFLPSRVSICKFHKRRTYCSDIIIFHLNFFVVREMYS